MTADDVRRALEARHPEQQGEWVVLHEWMAVDTLAVRCWTAGVGCRRVAYEIKVSRADFNRELAKPQKRRFACEVSHGYAFAMPWELAQRVKLLVPKGLGLVGVLDSGLTRSITRPAWVDPRPLSVVETAHILRHRATPPALRHALMERFERNEEIRKLRAQKDDAVEFAVRLLHETLVPGARVGPVWSPSAYLEVVAPPRQEKGRQVVLLRHVTGGDEREEDHRLDHLVRDHYLVKAPA